MKICICIEHPQFGVEVDHTCPVHGDYCDHGKLPGDFCDKCDVDGWKMVANHAAKDKL